MWAPWTGALTWGAGNILASASSSSLGLRLLIGNVEETRLRPEDSEQQIALCEVCVYTSHPAHWRPSALGNGKH